MSNNELQNSPLHGLSAETMLTELVEFYGWAVLDAAIDLKCFRIQPTIPSALAFLKKAEWARNRVEDFYLYGFKGMPKASEQELELKPRERGFPDGVAPKKPKPLSIKEARAMAPVAPEPIKAPRQKPKPRYVEPEPELEEPTESTFKSRFSQSSFRKER
ncbi:DNA-binding protein [Pontiella desulfatans]|uniref:DNA-binding protein n=1 Tax=Pontiella desulfatans TaxID=2750659 RepID=A0A6C2U551_PONDE|nr:VF530 family DNA-binding protein [Pontiella desulfatans]VGO15013.1 DNA-binding protein [Pontiella desulfatans]